MSRPSTSLRGFSTVELLITLFIGFLFISMGFQLYSVIINRGNNQGDFAAASTFVATQLELYTNYAYGSATYACPTPPAEYTQAIANIGGNAYTIRVACPNPSDLPNLRLMTIYLKYKTAEVAGARYFLQP